MKKLTSLAIKTYMICTTICVFTLAIAAFNEIFRPKTSLHTMDFGPALMITAIACVNSLLESYLKKHEANEITEIQ